MSFFGEKDKNIKQIQINSQKCLICSNNKCNQSIDHQFISGRMLAQIVSDYYVSDPVLEDMKKKVRQYYKMIMKNIKTKLIDLQKETQSYLNGLCFSEQIFNKKVDTNFLGSLIYSKYNKNYDYSSFSKKTIKQTIKIFQQLENDNPSLKNSLNMTRISQSESEGSKSKNNDKKIRQISQAISNFSQSQFTKKIEMIIRLPLSPTEQEQIKIQKESLLQLQSYQLGNIDFLVSQEQLYEQPYVWHIPLTRNLKNLPINSKRITDSQALINLPYLTLYDNIVELQMRHNLITHIGCMGIAECMPHLKTLDLRRNPNIGAKGIEKLKKMNNLTQLLVDECQLGDQIMEHIASGFEKLVIFWADNNNITHEGIKTVCNKDSLKIVSVVGNPIHKAYYQDFKDIFRRKGIINF